MLTSVALAEIAIYDSWLDDNVAQVYKDQPLAQTWARVTKVGEELGEAISALIAATGQNPRKPHDGDIYNVLAELSDVVLTGVLAIQHLTKDSKVTQSVLERKLHNNMARSGIKVMKVSDAPS